MPKSTITIKMNIVKASECMGKKMIDLLDRPDAARLQATVLALATMGAYSPPFGKQIDADSLCVVRGQLMERKCFPFKTLDECVNAFSAALVTYENEAGVGTIGGQL